MALARYIDDFSHEGCRAVRLENDHLVVTLLPDIAGKIVEITDRHTGRNWLWSNAALPHRIAHGVGRFETCLDSGGWDEILLSVAPCTVTLPDGTSVDAPDHGDLVGRPWQIAGGGVDGSGNAYCELEASGQATAYAWRRKLVLEHNRPQLRFEYQVENTGVTGWPFFWCAHPLLATEHGMRILLPAGQAYRLDSSHNALAAPAISDDRPQRWPLWPAGAGRLVDLANCVDPPLLDSGFAAKVFVRSTEPAQVVVESADRRERLLLQYDADAIPWLGLWINNRGWAGSGGRPYLNLGLEPATASSDSLAQALARDEVPILQPGESRQWWLDLTVHSTQPDPGTARAVAQ